MPSVSDFYFTSTNGINQIRTRLWIPDGTPKAIVQIEHGIAEHVERYDDFMSFLASNGYVAAADDHLGHGKSVRSSEDIGFFAEDDGWAYVVADIHQLRKIMTERYPGIPFVLFGHSMGSFLARTYIAKHPEEYDAVILSGTGMQSPLLIRSGLLISELYTRRKGPHASGDLLNSIAFGSYCKGIDHPRTAYDWLSRDPATVDSYISDPLCGFVCACSLYRDMMSGIQYVCDKKTIDLVSKTAPVFFFSGDRDPVGDYGKGVSRAYKAFCDAGINDVYLKLYKDGRHEMLNEINKQEVYQDILDWIRSRVC